MSRSARPVISSLVPPEYDVRGVEEVDAELQRPGEERPGLVLGQASTAGRRGRARRSSCIPGRPARRPGRCDPASRTPWSHPSRDLAPLATCRYASPRRSSQARPRRARRAAAPRQQAGQRSTRPGRATYIRASRERGRPRRSRRTAPTAVVTSTANSSPDARRLRRSRPGASTSQVVGSSACLHARSEPFGPDPGRVVPGREPAGRPPPRRSRSARRRSRSAARRRRTSSARQQLPRRAARRPSASRRGACRV